MFGLTLTQLAIAAIILAAVCAVVYVALRQFGMMPPAWAVHILWILVIAFVAVVAVLLLSQLWTAAGRA